jgi:hypothetical protein
MGANAVPRYTATPNNGYALVDAANTNSDGTGNVTTPTMYVLITAGTNGTLLNFVRVMVSASAASTANAATVIRLYLSTISSGATTNANTHLIAEIAIPSITADQSTVSTPYFDVPLGMDIPSGYLLLASSHVAANASQHNSVSAFADDY